MDSSEITLNVCLGKNFTGGSVFFNGVRGTTSERSENFEFAHSVGKAILHVGNRKKIMRNTKQDNIGTELTK